MGHAVQETMIVRQPDDSGFLSDGAASITSPISSAWPTSQSSPQSDRKHSGPVWGPQRVLNIEGEGLAGLSALFILKELIEVVSGFERRSGSSSSAASPLYRTVSPVRRGSGSSSSSAGVSLPFVPCHYFDFICGSSFGGLSAVMLGVMRFTIEETIYRYDGILRGMNPSISKASMIFVSWDRKARNSSSLEQSLRAALEESVKTTVFTDNSLDQAHTSLTHTVRDLAIMEANKHWCKT
jgi:hypothetical protein